MHKKIESHFKNMYCESKVIIMALDKKFEEEDAELKKRVDETRYQKSFQ